MSVNVDRTFEVISFWAMVAVVVIVVAGFARLAFDHLGYAVLAGGAVLAAGYLFQKARQQAGQ